jgi:hypothetical protein
MCGCRRSQALPQARHRRRPRAETPWWRELADGTYSRKYPLYCRYIANVLGH